MNDLSPLAVASVGSFFVGGRSVRLEGLPLRERVSTPGGPVHHVDPNGEIIVGQMYVQYVQLAAGAAASSLLMWHGGGMTGANWETTPAGRDGRCSSCAQASRPMCRMRSSGTRFVRAVASRLSDQPYFRTARELWEDTFRFGPQGSWHADGGLRRAYPGLRFPVDAFESFHAQCVPRWGCNDELTQAAYDALVRELDPGVLLLTHSQGGNFGLSAALAAPERVRAVVSL